MVAIIYDPYEDRGFEDQELVEAFDLDGWIQRQFATMMRELALLEKIDEVRPEGRKQRRSVLGEYRHRIGVVEKKFPDVHWEPEQEVKAKKAHSVKDAVFLDQTCERVRADLILLVSIVRKRNEAGALTRADKKKANIMANQLVMFEHRMLKCQAEVYR